MVDWRQTKVGFNKIPIALASTKYLVEAKRYEQITNQQTIISYINTELNNRKHQDVLIYGS